MVGNEEQRLLGILQDLQTGNKAGAGWMWNPATRRIESGGNGGPGCLYLGADDLGHAGERGIGG